MADSRRHFVILSTARSGSTLLVDLLNNHSDLRCQLEPLNREVLSDKKLTGAKKYDLLRHIKESIDKESKQVVGFKIFLEHMSDNGLTMKDVLGLLNNPKVIVLYRRCLLETYVSLQIALRNDKWYSMTDANKESVEIDWEDFMSYSNEWREMWKSAVRQVDDFIKPGDRTFVTYDDICKDRNGTIQNMFAFLGLPQLLRKLECYSVKQNPGRLQQKIMNYESLSDRILAGHDYVTLSF